MDLQRLKEKMEDKLINIKVGLRYKAIHRGKQMENKDTASKKVRVIYVDLDLDNFQ